MALPRFSSHRHQSGRKRILCLLDDGGKGRALVHGEVGHHLAVEFDAGEPGAVHELRIGQPFGADSGIDALDPQGAEVALAVAAVAIGILQRLLHRLLGDADGVLAAAAIALGLIEQPLAFEQVEQSLPTNLRDALRLLEHEGWVVKQPRRGVTVREFSAGEAAEVYALLIAVEGVALDWALDRMTRTRLMELAKLLTKARKAVGDDDTAAVNTLFDFHERLVLHSGKALTADVARRLYNFARLLEALRQTRTPRDTALVQQQLQAHERLLRLIEAGDRTQAHAALTALLSDYAALVFPVLTEQKPKP